MKHLNQIILCSESEGRSFLRELAVFDEFAIVTHVEAMPFRYHETLKKLKNPTEKKAGRLALSAEPSVKASGWSMSIKLFCLCAIRLYSLIGVRYGVCGKQHLPDLGDRYL